MQAAYRIKYEIYLPVKQAKGTKAMGVDLFLWEKMRKQGNVKLLIVVDSAGKKMKKYEIKSKANFLILFTISQS